MPRTPRRLQLAENVCYHVINRGHYRETVFRDDADRLAFLARLADFKARFQLKISHYCLIVKNTRDRSHEAHYPIVTWTVPASILGFGKSSPRARMPSMWNSMASRIS